MSGDTPTYLLPYPEATDLAYLGAAAVQQLAERVDTAFGPSVAHINPTTDGSAFAAHNDVVVKYPGGLTTSTADWTLSADKKTLQYAGPTRWFLVSGYVKFRPPVDVAASVVAAVKKNGAVLATATATHDNGATNFSPTWTVKPGPVPVQMSAGDQINMTANVSAGTLPECGLTVVALFGAQS